MKDPIKNMQQNIKVNIDFILKDKEINKATINKVRNIILPSITIFSHRTLKVGNHIGIKGHVTRKSIRSELSKFMEDYFNELTIQSLKIPSKEASP